MCNITECSVLLIQEYHLSCVSSERTTVSSERTGVSWEELRTMCRGKRQEPAGEKIKFAKAAVDYIELQIYGKLL